MSDHTVQLHREGRPLLPMSTGRKLAIPLALVLIGTSSIILVSHFRLVREINVVADKLGGKGALSLGAVTVFLGLGSLAYALIPRSGKALQPPKPPPADPPRSVPLGPSARRRQQPAPPSSTPPTSRPSSKRPTPRPTAPKPPPLITPKLVDPQITKTFQQLKKQDEDKGDFSLHFSENKNEIFLIREVRYNQTLIENLTLKNPSQVIQLIEQINAFNKTVVEHFPGKKVPQLEFQIDTEALKRQFSPPSPVLKMEKKDDSLALSLPKNQRTTRQHVDFQQRLVDQYILNLGSIVADIEQLEPKIEAIKQQVKAYNTQLTNQNIKQQLTVNTEAIHPIIDYWKMFEQFVTTRDCTLLPELAKLPENCDSYKAIWRFRLTKCFAQAPLHITQQNYSVLENMFTPSTGFLHFTCKVIDFEKIKTSKELWKVILDTPQGDEREELKQIFDCWDILDTIINGKTTQERIDAFFKIKNTFTLPKISNEGDQGERIHLRPLKYKLLGLYQEFSVADLDHSFSRKNAEEGKIQDAVIEGNQIIAKELGVDPIEVKIENFTDHDGYIQRLSLIHQLESTTVQAYAEILAQRITVEQTETLVTKIRSHQPYQPEVDITNFMTALTEGTTTFQQALAAIR